MTLSSAIERLPKAMNSLAKSLASSFERAFFNGLRTGTPVRCKHPETGEFRGHIAERRTDATYTVARESDGVLVHLPRTSVVRDKP